MVTKDIGNIIAEKGLKVTPQRVAVMEAVIKLKNHPTAENITDYIQKKHPNIAMGTVYKVLDVLVDNGLLQRVKTDSDVMRYDAILEQHHHLYCIESDKIENYFDDDLNTLLSDYFRNHKIPDFEISDIKLQIIGKFKNLKSKTN
jgi:Fur family peroxide stress response transcriptional regulator